MLTTVAQRKAVIAKQIVKMCTRGATIAEAAKHNGISERTVDRILKTHRDSGNTSVVKRGRPSRSRLPYALTQRRKKPEIAVDPVEINTIYKRLYDLPVPYPEHVDDAVFAREVASLCALQTTSDEAGVIRPRSHVGLRVCVPFFPNRYHATWKNSSSAADAWNDETSLKRAIRFQLEHGDPVIPHRVLRALTLSCRTPTVFRPGVALFVYQNFCPPGGRVYDPCAGFGGRLLGAFAAGVHYTGTDVDIVTVEGNRKLAERLGANYDLIVAPAETFNPPKVDLVFTSPPYFDRERYSHAENQTWKKHGHDLDAWLEGFLRPVVERAHKALSGGGYLVLNIADLKERGKVVPLVSRTIELAVQSGFAHVKTLLMPLAAINRANPAEPVLVFRR